MKSENSDSIKEGFNQWTIPWAAPTGPDIDAIKSGAFKAVDFQISEDDISRYQQDGVLFLKGAFTDWVKPLKEGLERNIASPQSYRFPAESTRADAPGRFFDSYCNWNLIPEFERFVFHSGAAALAGKIMQSSAAQFFHEHVFVKEAGTQRTTPFHQDIPYYCVSGDQGVSVYVALDPVDENMSVKYVKGSHKWGKTYFPKVWLNDEDFNIDEEGYDGPVPDIMGQTHLYDLVSWQLEPGDTILFSFKTLHGTSEGEMNKKRSAFSTRWMGDDMRYLERSGETSPPFIDTGMLTGDKMREDWFPVVWRQPG
ncbi:MAG: phytanoyl-CoA dioxygenase family protein [bacterium]